jgi:DNA-binding MarR family transcriptional regulator
MNSRANANVSGDTAIHAEREQEITLHLLDAVIRDPSMTQRRIAAELEVALGLINAYFKRCVKKGLIKVSSVPKRRYAYYLTPQGFAEKARLTQTYLSHSFTFFRNARQDCRAVLEECAQLGWQHVALAGGGDLAEIMILCAADSPITLSGIIASTGNTQVAGLPVVTAMSELSPPVHGVIITDMEHPQAAYEYFVGQLSPQKVRTPNLLRVIPFAGGTP